MISVVVMLVFSKSIVSFIERHPALKILGLSFLLPIGTLLVAEGFHQNDRQRLRVIRDGILSEGWKCFR